MREEGGRRREGRGGLPGNMAEEVFCLKSAPIKRLKVKQGSNWTGTQRNGVPVLFLKTGTAFRFIFFENSERKSDSGIECCD